LIIAKNLTHKFDYLLFKDVSLSVKPNEKVAIIGVSGSGKSTLLHILSTFLKPNNGEVLLLNKNIYKISEDELIKIRKKDSGIIFQFHYLFNGFSAVDNLKVASILADTEIDNQLLKRLKVDDVINQNIQTLSGGQQQRVSIARVLTKKPKIIFADEPTGNLDRETAFEVMNILDEYCETNGASLVMVTHDIEIAKKCDTIYKLENKQLTEWTI
jgi:putative ABC transport system ATP-binding protein